MPIIREELSPKGNILRKLGYYAVGLALGFIMLGFFQRGRQAELARMRAAAEAAANEPLKLGMPVPPGTLETLQKQADEAKARSHAAPPRAEQRPNP